MEKYLGNKRVLLPALGKFVQETCGQAEWFCDIFSGTTNVARHFRRKGYRVISNDINRFSFVLGKAYLGLKKYPRFDRLAHGIAGTNNELSALKAQFQAASYRDRGVLFPLERTDSVWKRLTPAANVLAYLNRKASETEPRVGRIVDHYTAWGKQADFTSMRGNAGKRNYFSLENAKKIDVVLETIRDWWMGGYLREDEVFVLMTSVLEEIVITANVNGTFHDFNRKRLWPNALQEFGLRVPLLYAAPQTARITSEDALEIAGRLPKHEVLYIDPPYNFRQYTAYYHFLNFVAAYPFLPDVDKYLDQIGFVRGQNMNDDFASKLSVRDRFIPSLRAIIDAAPAENIILSYYGGRNHWNHWSDTDTWTDVGYKKIQELFEDPDLFECCEVSRASDLRQNYQSRNGEYKAMVDEYFFWGRKRAPSKRRRQADKSTDPVLSGLNERLGLHQFTEYL